MILHEKIQDLIAKYGSLNSAALEEISVLLRKSAMASKMSKINNIICPTCDGLVEHSALLNKTPEGEYEFVCSIECWNGSRACMECGTLRDKAPGPSAPEYLKTYCSKTCSDKADSSRAYREARIEEEKARRALREKR